ncbi:DUF58 domain-containing protein [Clostridium intestinale]|uniref:DUF58 domain-containing protein n=1 Tax=Clostridium intestinale URNW TaxID=1294142 RepID=U2PU43_9CLOT|nr:DUF58 domain-containing protein [Clostridium intestinale]ERK29960.1 hypothetical protein CINTURNW_3012 [Clostridium intestinale URNW]
MQEKIFDKDFFNQLKNLKIIMKTPINSAYAGGRRSKEKGVSVEFSDFREYSPGDDFRRVDWNAYGRFNKLYLKIFMEEREALFNIFIDTSKSMHFGVHNKGIFSLRLAGAISHIVLNGNDRVKLFPFNSEENKEEITISGRAGINRILKYLEAIEFNGTTNLGRNIKTMPIKGKGISVVLSDFYNLEELKETLIFLKHKGQEIILVQVLSQEELEPTLRGDLKLNDIEEDSKMDISLYGKAIEIYKDKLDEFIMDIKTLSRKYGATYILANTKDNLEKIIFKEFTSRGIINRK